jgi:malonyl CoA-acyl carrier protein transacylase
MSTALLFPGQAAQFVGMGARMSATDKAAKELLDRADGILGYEISKIMAEGPEEDLKQTVYTQPAVYIHSMLVFNARGSDITYSAVAGHSLGEISACVAAGVMTFEDGLRLVQCRAEAMQEACDSQPGTMAAILGMEDEAVEDICEGIEGVIPANYNCPGQIVISGTKEGIEQAIITCQEAGARRALEINVGGAFHSRLMEPAVAAFEKMIHGIDMKDASIPVYQNVDAKPHKDAATIRQNLINQVTSPVRWTRSMQNMISDQFDSFKEVGGKGKILMGMMRKISRDVTVEPWVEE